MKQKIQDILYGTLVAAVIITTISMCSCGRPQPTYWQTGTSLNTTPANLPEPTLTEEQLERLYGVTITHDERGEIWHVKRQK